MARELDTTRPMSERHSKCRRALIDPLADVWLAAYQEAAASGLLDTPSGPAVTDPREKQECGAAATLCSRAGMHGSFPACWGGSSQIWRLGPAEVWQRTDLRWSA